MNVLFLMDDQHHPHMLSDLGDCPKGIDGKPLVETPNLNRLMREGVYFRHAFTPTAICGPSRTCIYTGQYPFVHGQYTNPETVRINETSPSLLSEFRRRGYRTAMFGKNHLPNAIGKDFEIRHDLRDFYGQVLPELGIDTEKKVSAEVSHRFESWISKIPPQHSTEAWTAEGTLNFLDQQGTQPFFAWVSFERPHEPHSPDPETAKLVDPDRIPLPWDDYELFERTVIQPRPGREHFWKLGGWGNPRLYQEAVARYYSLIGLIDQQIGRILAKLEERKLRENTLILFCPDHGDFGGDFGQLGKNVPVYEQLYKVPLLWADPTQPQDHGKVVEGLWETIDIYPSLMERLGWETPPTVQGVSFLQALAGWRPTGKDRVFCETTMCKMLRTREFKLAFHLDRPDHGQLFRMLPRPDELHNCWDDPACREVRDGLVRQLLHHLATNLQPRAVSPDWEPLYPTRHNQWLVAHR